jgi:hypothetical protein
MRGLQICTTDPVAESDETERIEPACPPVGETGRGDALPEHIQYRDEGCDLSPSCLNCTLPLCRYDQPGGVRRLRTRGRDEEIVRLRRRERLPIEALARRFGVSRRTVFRILERNPPRRAGGNGRQHSIPNP